MGNIKLDRPLTILDCASMAKYVYTSTGYAEFGWREVTELSRGVRDPSWKGGQGFYGTAYIRDGNLVVAYRGTSDSQDVADDALMAPVRTPEQARVFGQQFMTRYLKRSGWTPEIVGKIFGLLYSRRGVNAALKAYANSIPEVQGAFAVAVATHAGTYARENGLRLRCVVGHSLGGALAQYVSEQTGRGGKTHLDPLPGVSFNAPCMGSIKNMRPGAGGGLVVIHADFDPLSLSTGMAGNASHSNGKNEYSLSVTPYDKDPPADLIPNVSTPADLGRYIKPFSEWMGGALLYYHTMDTLFSHLQSHDPGKKPLSDFYP
jgi:hypothetical protein